MPAVKMLGGDFWVPVDLTETASRYFFKWGFANGWRDLKDEIKALDGAKWEPEDKQWSIKKNEHNAFQLRYLLGQNPYEWYERELPTVETDRDLWPKQQQMLDHMYGRRRCIVAGDMGVGKSLSAIALIEKVKAKDAWFVCNKNGLESFTAEQAKWNARQPVRMITYDGVKRLIDCWDGSQAPQLVIFDEGSYLKSPTSERSVVAQYLADAMRKEWGDDCWIIIMSGTPAPNDPSDWWKLAEIVCPGFIREGNIKKFEQRYAIKKQVDLGTHKFWTVVQWRDGGKCESCWDPGCEQCDWLGDEDCPGCQPEGCQICDMSGRVDNEVIKLGNRLDGLVLRVELEGNYQKTFERRRCEYDPALVSVAELELATAENPLTAMTILRQLSDGIYKGKRIDCPKDDIWRGVLRECEDIGRVVGYAAFYESIDRMVEIAEEEGWVVWRLDGRGSSKDFQSAYRTFQYAGGKMAFVGHPESGGMGLTLVASDTVFFYSNTYKTTDRMQAMARVCRPGMRDYPAKVIDAVNLPIDDQVINRVDSKSRRQTMSMDRIKRAMA